MLRKVVAKKGKQSAKYPQNAKVLDGEIEFAGKIGEVNEKVFLSKNPKHLAKPEKNLKGQQQKLTQKKDDSNSRRKYRKVFAKVYVGVACAWSLLVSNSHQDFLHKLSFMLVNELQADGTAVSAEGGKVRPQGGRKSVLSSSPMSSEAPTIASA